MCAPGSVCPRRLLRLLIILVVGQGLAVGSAARANSRAQVLIQPGACPLVVDGRLDEPLWARVTPIAGFVQADPDQGSPATERTEVRLVVDDSALYVGARLHDSQAHQIIARMDRRDGSNPSDSFTVFLDPQRDRLTGVYFGVSAAGTQHDGTMSNDDWRDDTWDPVWDSEVSRDGQGWTVEMRIPLSQLRFDGAANRRWGINLRRVIERKHERAVLAFTPRAQNGFVSRFLELEGVETVRPPAMRLELAPYVSGRTEYRLREADDPFTDGGPMGARAGAGREAGAGRQLHLRGGDQPGLRPGRGRPGGHQPERRRDVLPGEADVLRRRGQPVAELRAGRGQQQLVVQLQQPVAVLQPPAGPYAPGGAARGLRLCRRAGGRGHPGGGQADGLAGALADRHTCTPSPRARWPGSARPAR